MRKKIKIFLLILVVGFLGCMLFVIAAKIKNREALENRISQLPEFRLEDLNGGVFTNRNLLDKIPLVLVYFNPKCDLCQIEARAFSNRRDDLNNIQVLFISAVETGDIKAFAHEYGLMDSANIHVLRDSGYEIARFYEVTSVPMTILYNADKVLIERFKGPVKIDFMLKMLKDGISTGE